MEVGAITDTGLRKAINEDSYEAWFTTIEGTERGFFAVADGVGGEDKGEVASKESLAIIFQNIYPLLSKTTKPAEDELKELIEDSVKEANNQIISMWEESGLGKMATTLTMGVMMGEFFTIANVGDSRTYIYRNNKLHRLTKDHSLIEHLVEKGKLTEEDIEVPRSERAKMHENIVTRAIGDKRSVEVDLYTTYLLKGDQILLCCDGLTDLVTREKIIEIIDSSPSAKECCINLVKAANDEGGKDNITVVMVRPENLPSKEEILKRDTVMKI